MKSLSVIATLLGLLAAGPCSAFSTVTLPAEFKPPPVFKNTNLVQIVSVEKSYAKEHINVLVENVSGEPQDEYFLPFTADQIARLGGIEAKDRKDDNVGPFGVDLVEYNPLSDVQYYRITLPKPLKAGAQQALAISWYYLRSYRPLPASIGQDDQQFLVYDFSLYAASAYPTLKQKTEVKLSTVTVPDSTTIIGSGGKEYPERHGSKLLYGPFDEQPAGAVYPAQVRFEFTKPVIHVSTLERDVEVSHWGGNVAFEERYTLHHRGANLSTLFNRVKWAQSQFYNPASSALKELKFPLQIGSVDPYFTDAIGNVSTSRFRSSKREAMLELKPRYPVFGGWKYPFTIGWNTNAANILRNTASGGHVLKIPFMEGPKSIEGVEYGEVNVRVLLPEGSENVKFYTSIPDSSIVETSIGVHKTYLDTTGRTAVVIKAKNLADDFRFRDLIISYETPLSGTLRKPVVVFASMLAVYAAAWAVGKVEVGFSSK
ncbi:oligosaccharyltransferase alpha subunit [Trichoderma arundinaceum]|uniref:Dolichyl-diphosphooligosaccharide--protein glycosyltransferase subunit 1 n=1 Tax=Trichoderma arundinaceum TaxID=490622 RepID=A0A395NPL4_TRIAR|nr:oligosaccharyltransferase alpha subunit [Trichoderma arundinaceum]